jgi:low temperature requirement protein LtrA
VKTLFGYIGLYIAVWFAWINGTLYHELHGNNDVRTRIFTFLQMFSLLWMAIFVSTALGEGYKGFAYAYAGFLATLTYLWWRTGVHDPEHRPLSGPYSLAFLGTTLAFLYSTLLSVESAHMLWFGAIIFSLVIPFMSIIFGNQANKDQVEGSQRIRSSLVERFGLLVIIVLGENLISIVGGATYFKFFTFETSIIVSLCLLMVFSLWRIYFDFISHRRPIQTTCRRMLWIYLHLPLTVSIGLTAVGLLNVIEHYGRFDSLDRWFLVGPTTLFLIIVSFLIYTLPMSDENRAVYRKAVFISLLSAGAILFVGTMELALMPTLGLIWVFLALPVFAGFKVWLRRSVQAGRAIEM